MGKEYGEYAAIREKMGTSPISSFASGLTEIIAIINICLI